MAMKVFPGRIDGQLKVNPSKSMMQRVVAASFLANGKTEITNPGGSHDSLAALEIVRSLGAKVEFGEKIVIEGANSNAIPSSVSCGESGLGIRMFTPILSLLDKPITINGEGSLQSRPMNFFEEILPQLGVNCTSNNGKVPIQIHGPIRGGEIDLDGSLTSQFLTGLLMALPNASEDSVLHVEGLRSRGYVDLTIEVMRRFGIKISNHDYKRFDIPGEQKFSGTEIAIEGDWSGAAFHMVAAAVSGIANFNMIQVDSHQPDKNILVALKSCGALINEGQNKVEISKNQLSGFQFDATDCPDLFPPLAALAANCIGDTVIKGTDRLTHKESNRADTIQSELTKLGIQVSYGNNHMTITGGQIQGGTIDSHNDHRIAMMGAILAINASAPITITNSSAINKSYPQFFEDLASLGIQVTPC